MSNISIPNSTFFAMKKQCVFSQYVLRKNSLLKSDFNSINSGLFVSIDGKKNDRKHQTDKNDCFIQFLWWDWTRIMQIESCQSWIRSNNRFTFWIIFFLLYSSSYTFFRSKALLRMLQHLLRNTKCRLCQFFFLQKRFSGIYVAFEMQ